MSPLLVDAKVPGQLGGTGHVIPEELVVELARHRKIILAGGLTEDNVGQRIAMVRPHGVDVASGVESSPGVKDSTKIANFVEHARRAAEL